MYNNKNNIKDKRNKKTYAYILALCFISIINIGMLFSCDVGSSSEDKKTDISGYSVTYAVGIINASVDNEISETPTLSSSATVSYSISPTLPAGLSIDGSTGKISGRPTADGGGLYTITATGNGDYSGSTSTTIPVIVLGTVTQSTTGDEIDTVEKLKAMANGGVSHLTANIDLSGETWEPLFSDTAPFTGTLHGNGYAIYNLTITDGGNYQGLFAATSGATIEHLGIGVGAISGNAAIGALVGYSSSNSTLTNIGVVPMSSSAIISSSGTVDIDGDIANHLGGLVGNMDTGTLTGFNLGLTVKGGSQNFGIFVGGLVGLIISGSTVSGYSTGSVSGRSYIGGLVGSAGSGRQNIPSTVIGYATGSVSGVSTIGGLAGDNALSTVIGYATGSVSASDSVVGGLVGNNTTTVMVSGYATGSVSVKGDNNFGGLAGSGTASGYWDQESSGQNTSLGGAGVTGVTATRNIVFDGANTYTDSGNDPATTIFDNAAFANVFDLTNGANATWPKLKTDFTIGANTYNFNFSQPRVSDLDGDGIIEVNW